MSHVNGTATLSQLPESDTVDVLICGSGSAGLACALWLAIYNSRYCTLASQSSNATPSRITYRVLESRNGPLEVGQADGVQCRTVEIYESLGLDHHILREGYWVNEVAFWAAEESHDNGSPEISASKGERRKIVRTGRTADVQPGLSHQPHLILNQARINNLMLDKIRQIDQPCVDYGWKVLNVATDGENANYPVSVTAERDGKQRTIRAKYVLGSDGAHSQVRRSLRIPMEGDSTNAVWGVMDIYPKTNFPDVRKKTTIRSDAGTLLIIPREGDSMIRTYIEMGHDIDPKQVKLEDLQNIARNVFYPYNIEFLKTAWWSAYSIGQRLARDIVDESGRIFLAGDACHTHSPKAGQGMNCSLQDGYNLGWKFAAVLTGQCDKKILNSYVQERQQYAHQLIEFDRYFAKLFSSSKKTGQKVSSEEFNQAFIKAGVFTAGMAAKYEASDLTAVSSSQQELAKKVIVGERLPSAQVVRMSDSKPVQLLKLLQSDGRWRVIIFGGDIKNANTIPRLNKIGELLLSQKGLLKTFTPNDQAHDSVIESLVMLHGDRSKLEFDQIHPAFKPDFHHLPLTNLHKIYFDDESYNYGHGRLYETLKIDPEIGCIVIARPDQYISAVIGLDNHQDLVSLFGKFLLPVS